MTTLAACAPVQSNRYDLGPSSQIPGNGSSLVEHIKTIAASEGLIDTIAGTPVYLSSAGIEFPPEFALREVDDSHTLVQINSPGGRRLNAVVSDHGHISSPNPADSLGISAVLRQMPSTDNPNAFALSPGHADDTSLLRDYIVSSGNTDANGMVTTLYAQRRELFGKPNPLHGYTGEVLHNGQIEEVLLTTIGATSSDGFHSVKYARRNGGQFELSSGRIHGLSLSTTRSNEGISYVLKGLSDRTHDLAEALRATHGFDTPYSVSGPASLDTSLLAEFARGYNNVCKPNDKRPSSSLDTRDYGPVRMSITEEGGFTLSGNSDGVPFSILYKPGKTPSDRVSVAYGKFSTEPAVSRELKEDLYGIARDIVAQSSDVVTRQFLPPAGLSNLLSDGEVASQGAFLSDIARSNSGPTYFTDLFGFGPVAMDHHYVDGHPVLQFSGHNGQNNFVVQVTNNGSITVNYGGFNSTSPVRGDGLRNFGAMLVHEAYTSSVDRLASQ